MNIQDFIKTKEEELRAIYLKSGKDILGGNLPFRIMSEDEICNFLSQSLLEYNEKIKEMIEKIDIFEPEEFDSGGDDEYGSRRVAVDNSRRWGQSEMKEKILTNLTQDTNPKE